MKRALLPILLLGCPDPEAIPGVQVRMDFASAELYAAPFPSEHLRREDGTVDISGFPNPKGVSFVRELKRVINTEAALFGTTSGVFFTLTGPPEAPLPTLQESLHEDAPVFLIVVGFENGNRIRRVPITVDFREDGGPHGAPNMLSILPLQGAPLLPVLHAVVIRRRLVSGVSKEMRFLAEGERPQGMSERAYQRYRTALDFLDEAGVPWDDIAGLSVFQPGDPTHGMGVLARSALALKPAVEDPFRLTEVYPDFCVFHTTVEMPVFQSGEPPYLNEGGELVFDSRDALLQRREEADFWLTIPRRDAPAGGYPTVVFSRTGGGGERPLVDRGRRATPGGPAIEPGSGPARTFARAGWAGLSIDGPHGGLRNVTGGDEQLLIFNFNNPVAMRDNIRQSAAELAIAGALIEDVTVTSTCPGTAATIELDEETTALMGHSMGATIAPLVTGFAFDALILSGAGGSWIENVIYKESPLRVRAFAELLIEYEGYELHRHDPVLSLLQWAGEPADPPAYHPFGARGHVLMFQGIVDTYILPPIANATSLALGLSPAEPVLEESIAELSASFGRNSVSLPSSANVVVQYEEDGIEDGHEIVFQREEPKHQIRCFLESLARGAPVVVPAAPEDAPCP